MAEQGSFSITTSTIFRVNAGEQRRRYGFTFVERKMQGRKVPVPTRIIPCRIKSDRPLNGTDPIWIWGNTGQSVVNVHTAWSWGNPCGFDWNTFFQWHRDAENTSLPNPTVLPHQGGGVSGLGGTPKPGYTPYTYPHPLRSSPPPATQSATPSSVQDHVGPDSSSRLELGRAVSNR